MIDAGRAWSRRGALRLAGATGLAVVAAPAACASAAPVPLVPGIPADVPTPAGAPLREGPVADVRALGARGDGRADDAPAFRRALQGVATPGGPRTLAVPAGRYRLALDEPLRVPAGVIVAGEPGRSFLLPEPAPGTRAELVGLLVDAPGVTLDGLVVERLVDVDTVLVRLGQVDGFRLSRSVLLGHTDALTRFAHGVQVGTADGTSSDLALTDSSVATTTYGLYQANPSRAVTQGVAVRGCTFVRNADTDLEFNSPSGSFRDVRVERCTFRDHDAPGFAVGVAHCADVAIRGCTVERYRMEAVHVEDFSTDVLVEDNTFTACGLTEFAHVQVIAGARRVTVRGNRHDATMNTRPIPIVGGLPGGEGLTAGGRPLDPPTEVTVADNEMRCAAGITAVAFDDVPVGAITGNRVDGPDLDAPDDAFVLRGTGAVRVEGNVLNGRPS
ncbi:right-handed parallel beta-helix repeat-containing protein [Actinomycetospora sp. CA-101289]|uniref:right-handed parallel beta-helix repeat-containing protein n=1 Tax=Actinomycetospora sp. CA-101289 TaxID=3239893 RepID=UPI003D9810C4